MNEVNLGALVQLGKDIRAWDEDFQEMTMTAHASNGWFTPEEIKKSLLSLSNEFLTEKKLEAWKNQYAFDGSTNEMIVGLIFAGNLPAVGFHDLLCGMVSPYKLHVKLSHKDDVIIPFLVKRLWEYLEIPMDEKLQFVERLESFDAVVATGGDHAYNVFKEYFSGVPNIIRGHRNSLAYLDGAESDDVLMAMGHDIFDFFGMGCRNVSKVFVPQGYDWHNTLKIWEDGFSYLKDHHKYRNNFDYSLALYLLNRTPHLQSENLVLVEDKSLTSRLACLHYEEYKDRQEVIDFVLDHNEQIQCVVSDQALNRVSTVKPGKAQSPQLNDYADNIDTMAFLTSL